MNRKPFKIKKRKDAIKSAIDFGIDVTLLYKNLQLTPTDRIKQNLNYIKEANELRIAGKRKLAES
jgi:hypothetical protein